MNQRAGENRLPEWVRWAGPSDQGWSIHRRTDGSGHPWLVAFHVSGAEVEMMVPGARSNPMPEAGCEGSWQISISNAEFEQALAVPLEQVVGWLPGDWGTWAKKRHREAMEQLRDEHSAEADSAAEVLNQEFVIVAGR